jgi:hypothetical protein
MDDDPESGPEAPSAPHLLSLLPSSVCADTGQEHLAPSPPHADKHDSRHATLPSGLNLSGVWTQEEIDWNRCAARVIRPKFRFNSCRPRSRPFVRVSRLPRSRGPAWMACHVPVLPCPITCPCHHRCRQKVVFF